MARSFLEVAQIMVLHEDALPVIRFPRALAEDAVRAANYDDSVDPSLPPASRDEGEYSSMFMWIGNEVVHRGVWDGDWVEIVLHEAVIGFLREAHEKHLA